MQMVLQLLIAVAAVADGDADNMCDAANGTMGLNFPGGDLERASAVVTATACRQACVANVRCVAFVFHHGNCSGHGEPKGVVCYLKDATRAQATNPCTCSGVVRPPPPAPPPPPPSPTLSCPTRAPRHAPKGAKHVLYVLVDDLRPSLSPYGQTQVHTPNIQQLADHATVFERAYCQEAVCSPSRNSFLSGRGPDRTRVYNFINHFRQAYTGLEFPRKAVAGPTLQSINIRNGAGGECGTKCTIHPDCKSWTYHTNGALCELKSIEATAGTLVDAADAISGHSGSMHVATSWNWTALPELFRLNGYLTQGTGKIYHTEEGGDTGCWDGQGMPPNQDPPSWTAGGSMSNVNAVAPMVSCADEVVGLGLQVGCADNATLDGELLSPVRKGKRQLCDKVIYDDALMKLHKASSNFNSTGQRFFLAVGFRKPHTPWRFPYPYLQFYNNVSSSKVDVAEHPTLDPSVPPIAISSFDFQNPYEPMARDSAEGHRLAYYAAVSWMDHQVGKVLAELDNLGLSDSTVVAFHADHGWNLGEHGQWQKFTNWETGVRVPLIIRDPSLPASHGKRSMALVELLDVYPTLADLAGVPLPAGETLDGSSLGTVLRAFGNVSSGTRNAAGDGHGADGGGRGSAASADLGPRGWALSQYPRCPKSTNASDFYQNNVCEFVERSEIPYMGYSLRVDAWRYTEWVAWDGANLRPQWGQLVGAELYSHDPGETSGCNSDVNACFDHFENVNMAKQRPDVVANLSAQLHQIVAQRHPNPAMK